MVRRASGRSRASRSRGSVEVDLVEDVSLGPAPAGAAVTRTARVPGRGPGWREHAALTTAGLVAFATVVAGVDLGREGARDGGQAPGDAPWLEPWRAAGRVLGAVGDVVMLTGEDGTGVQGRAASDGAVRWGPAAVGSDCALLDGPAVLCTATTYSSGGPVATALGPDGQELGSFVPAGSVVALWVVDADLVVLGRDAGHLVATRWTPTTATAVWRYRSEDPVVAPAGYPFSAERVGDQLVVGGTRAVVLRLDAGVEVPPVRGAGIGPDGE